MHQLCQVQYGEISASGIVPQSSTYHVINMLAHCKAVRGTPLSTEILTSLAWSLRKAIFSVQYQQLVTGIWIAFLLTLG